jgi:DMSO/TMAO reductase YedYZ molybdopterin-dependent catalytic subunit
MNSRPMNPRRFFLRSMSGLGALALAGCDRLAGTEWFPKVLALGQRTSQGVHHLLTPRKAMAQEFTEADLSPDFRSNGNAEPDNPRYRAMAANGFVDWQLTVDGLVDKPLTLTLAGLRAMKSRTQITRHDCVEGWSAIGKWTGVPLGDVLALAAPKAQARFVVFHCADPMHPGGQDFYYESIDMDDAFHPQTILAYELNGRTLPVRNGAPVRLRVERQLGYKMAKYVERIELVEDFGHIAGGNGGYWEDNGYQWYAGI